MRRLVLFLVLVLAFAGWVSPLDAGQQMVLSTDTPVVGVWRDSKGVEVGRYHTTLGQLHDVSAQITDHEARLADIEALIHEMVTDPKMRGHLVRHDVSERELDMLARRFGNR